MNEAAELRMGSQNSFINGLHNYITTHFPDGTILISQIGIKVLFLFLVFIVLDLFQSKVLLTLIKKTAPKTDNIWIGTFLEKNVFTSLFRLLPLGVCYLLVPIVFYHHPQSFHLLDVIFSILLVVFITKFLIGVLNAYTDIKNRDKSYRMVALKTFSELVKIIIIIFSVFSIISILFNLSGAKIATFLGAIMAVILLVFRDPILGFVSGMNVAVSKQVKIGDRVSIPKYNIEGNLKDINLVTTKIQNTDKTISTIPTYDLISVEVKNHEFMLSSNTKKIKRVLLLNLKTVKVVDESLFERLKEMKILNDFLVQKKEKVFNKNLEDIEINNGFLTNLEAFRVYIQLYLEKNKNISRNDTVVISLLDPTNYGIPIEINCFSNTSNSKRHEDIQAKIIEHLLIIISQFDLEIVVISP